MGVIRSLMLGVDENNLTKPMKVNSEGETIISLAAESVINLAASEEHIGEVSGPSYMISQTPTVTAGAYAAGDAVGGLLTFANLARIAGGPATIVDLIIIDDAGQDVEMELWLFDETFTAMADNAPWSPSEADLRKLVAVISTSGETWHAAGTPSVINFSAVREFIVIGTSVFGQLVTRGAPTFAATDDVTVILKGLQG